MTAPEHLVDAVKDLAEASRQAFQVTDSMVTNTQLYVVYAPDHWLPDKYTRTEGTFGFRVGDGYPESCPEDAFFIYPADIKLVAPDPVRRNTDLNRAAAQTGILTGTDLGDVSVLVFSWHLWNQAGKWKRGKHTLIDHYTHCLRRFDQTENG